MQKSKFDCAEMSADRLAYHLLGCLNDVQKQ